MSIAATAPYEDEIGGLRRRLLLRNGEIERFEDQYAPLGIFGLFDQLMGRGDPPQVRHVRDIVALGLVGGGMTDRAADELIAGLGPEHNLSLRAVAQRLLGLTFFPDARTAKPGKKGAGSRNGGSSASPDMTPAPGSPTSAA